MVRFHRVFLEFPFTQKNFQSLLFISFLVDGDGGVFIY